MIRHNQQEKTKLAKRSWWDKYGANVERRFLQTEKGRTHRAKMNAVRRAAIEIAASLTDSQWLAILRLFDYRCAYCARADKKLEQDHVVPLSKGGPHTKDTVVPACRSCNARKGSRLPQVLF
jgi:5-methylcytosine-specific restriction endonuclease McrA